MQPTDAAFQFAGARRKTAKGRAYWYFFPGKGAPSIALGSDDDRRADEAGFAERYRAARDGVARAVAPRALGASFVEPVAGDFRSFGWLCQQYFKGDDFRRLAGHGQGTRQTILEEVCALPWPARGCTFGDLAFTWLRREHFEAIKAGARTTGIGKLAGRPVKGIGVRYIKFCSILFLWAVAHQSTTGCTINPCYRLGRTAKATATSGRHRWTVEECHAFEDAHPVGTKARLAYELVRWLGVRVSDLIRLGPATVKNGKLHFTERKGSASQSDRVLEKRHGETVPAGLQAIIDATEDTGATHWLVKRDGQPYTSEGGVRAMFRIWCTEAGLSVLANGDDHSCMPHGLRKRAASDLARAGGSLANAKAKFGWTNEKMFALYADEVASEDMADDATARIAAERARQRDRAAGAAVVPFKPRRAA